MGGLAVDVEGAQSRETPEEVDNLMHYRRPWKGRLGVSEEAHIDECWFGAFHECFDPA
jgi:hypothetical protein